MKKLSFRFDIDTHKCLRDGVPNLLILAKKYNVHFTFFVNTGRAIHYGEFIKNKVRKTQNKEEIDSLSALKKLGVKDYIDLTMRNPLIANTYASVVKDIYEAGHEIGLHGGKNHEGWYQNAKDWDEKRIHDEVIWGKRQLENIDKKIIPSGFASPGWSGSDTIDKVLEREGFSYVADIHTDKPYEEVKKVRKFKQIPTNITGEPGGVGYIEHCRAKNFSTQKIVTDFKNKLLLRKHLAVMYDHPYYVGVQELLLLEKFIQTGLDMKYTFVTMKDL